MGRRLNTTMTDALMLVGGSVVGAGLALLLAPQSGKSCRKEIARFGKNVSKQSDKIMRSFSSFADTVSGMTSGVGHRRSLFR